MSEETSKKYPILIVKSQNPRSALEVSALVSGDQKAEIIYEMKPEEPELVDWGKLKENLKNSDFGFKGIRNKSLIANLRESGDPQVLSSETSGIHPVRDSYRLIETLSNKRLVPAAVDREKFAERMSQQLTLGTLSTLSEKAGQGDAEAAKLLQKLDALPSHIHYDPETQTASLVSSPREATGYIIDSMSQYTTLHKFNYLTSNQNFAPEPFEASTTTQRKKRKREAKISLKKGQNYLKIGKRQ